MHRSQTLGLVTPILVAALVPYLTFVCWTVAERVLESFEELPVRRAWLGDVGYESVCAEETREALHFASLYGAVLLVPAVPLGCALLLLRRRLKRDGDEHPSIAPAQST